MRAFFFNRKNNIMTSPIPPCTDTKNDSVKLPFTFDVDKMKQDLEAMNLSNFTYYEAVPLRSPAHMVDTSLPLPPPADDYADGSWTDWMNTPYLENAPYIKSIVEFFQEHTKVTLVRALRLEAGNVIDEHKDVTLGLQVERSVIRLTIPIISDDQVEFYLNNKIVPMKPGECWYMRLSDPHRVINNSAVDRINISIDMIPNDWVQSTILESDMH